jgi:hypothetical protein
MPKIRDVMLLSSLFADSGREYKDKISHRLALTLYHREDVMVSEGVSLLPVRMLFDLFQGLDGQPFQLMCSYRIVYELKDESEAVLLKDHVILAHVIPYLREHISGLTVKSRFPVLYIDTINTLDMLEEYNKSRATDSSEAPPSPTL